jgi:hypothetical protein
MPLIVTRAEYPVTSQEEKVFTTYRNYAAAFLVLIEHGYPTVGEQKETLERVLDRSTAQPGLDVGKICQLLTGAWSTELLMTQFQQEGSEVAIKYANVWSPVQSYYAIYLAGTAWLESLGISPRDHRATLNALTNRLAEVTCYPWNVTCAGIPRASDISFVGLAHPNFGSVSNLAIPRDFETAEMLLAKALKTTRDGLIDERGERWKKEHPLRGGRKRTNLPSGKRDELASRLKPTSILHFLQRARLRTNYKEADAFVTGSIDMPNARHFYEAQVSLTTRTLLLFEALIGSRFGAAFVQSAATRFSSDVGSSTPSSERWS